MRLDTRPIMAKLKEEKKISTSDAWALLDELHATRAEIARALVWHEQGQSYAAMNYIAAFVKGTKP